MLPNTYFDSLGLPKLSMAIIGPYSTLVASLNLKRWILPNVVFGNSSTKSILCGYWYR